MSDRVTRGKNIFVVLGMARTGSSVISRSLKTLGVDHGSTLISAGEDLNPKGFWEDKEVVYGVHRHVLSALKREVYEVRRIPAEQQTLEKLASASEAAMKLLNNRFSTSTCYGFKDPTTARLLPFWQNVFNEMALNVHYVLALRHPLACARSYQKLTGCDTEMGLALWCAYMVQAIEGTHGLRRVVVDYNLMLRDPHKQIDRLAASFPVLAVNEAEARQFSSEFIEDKLDRYGASDDAFHANHAAKAVTLSLDIYRLLLQVAEDSLDIEGEIFTHSWQKIMNKYNQIYPMHCYLEQLISRRKKLRLALRHIHKSWIWTLLAPLRWVDDALRQRRRQKHLMNRAVTPHA